MLTQTYRPRSFSEVLGSSFSMRLLKGIAKNPEKAPRSIILSGIQGCGKTTCARILPKAINCTKHTGDACNKCATCSEIDQTNNGYYVEYNCAHTGSVDSIRELQDSFSYSYIEGYRVIVFDEIHLSSINAQSALLQTVEEAPKDLFFVFCTTDSHQILDTLKSRSLEIFFESVPPKEIIQRLSEVMEKEKIQLSGEVLDCISKRCRGDVRSAFHMLEEAIIVGEEEFLNHVILLDKYFDMLFKMLVDPNSSELDYKKLIAQILKNPVEYIRSDFERCIANLSTKIYVDRIPGISVMESFVVEWLKNQRYLGGRNDWKIFFNSLRRFTPNRRSGISNDRQRFS